MELSWESNCFRSLFVFNAHILLMLSSFPLHHIANQLPRENLEGLCDVCVFQGQKFMIMANERTISIFVSEQNRDAYFHNPDRFILHQVLDCGFEGSSITAIAWTKSLATNHSQRGEFVVAFNSIIGFYAPQTLSTVSHTFSSMKVLDIHMN